MTKRTGLFIFGSVTALAAALLLLGFAGAPEPVGDSAPIAEEAPAPQYTAEDVLKHFEQQSQSDGGDSGSDEAAAPTSDTAITIQSGSGSIVVSEPDISIAIGDTGTPSTPTPTSPLPSLTPPGASVSGSGVKIDPETQTTGVLAAIPQSIEPSGSSAGAIVSATPDAPKTADLPTAGVSPTAPTPTETGTEATATQDRPLTPLAPQEEPALQQEPSTTGVVPPTVDTRTVPKLGTRGVSVSGTQTRPQFPWPPPQASTVVRLPLSRFEDALTRRVHGEIADLLESALDQGEYFDRSYWVAPGGFALATRLERITEDGEPVTAGERWPTSSLKERFDLSKYLRALFYTDPGFFRVIVFLVSTEFERTSDQEPTPKEAFRWLRRGMVMLPRDMAEQPVTERHELTALIYEFEREAGSNAVVLAPGRLSGRTHLARANLQRLLGAE